MSEPSTLFRARHGWGAMLTIITAYADGKPVWHWNGRQWRELGGTASFSDQWRNYRLDDPAQAERQRVIAEGIVAGREIFGDGTKDFHAAEPQQPNQTGTT